MGMTHGEEDTYPRTADVMGFCKPADALAVAEAVVTVQRDWGDRTNRKHARLKYTIEDRGLAAFRAEVERRIGKSARRPEAFRFDSNGDRYGWVEGEDGASHLTLFIENGRLRDIPGGPRAPDRPAPHRRDPRRRVPPHREPERDRRQGPAGEPRRDRRARGEHGLTSHATALRRNAMACVALPTCGLALAESERYLPDLVTASRSGWRSTGSPRTRSRSG